VESLQSRITQVEVPQDLEPVVSPISRMACNWLPSSIFEPGRNLVATAPGSDYAFVIVSSIPQRGHVRA